MKDCSSWVKTESVLEHLHLPMWIATSRATSSSFRKHVGLGQRVLHAATFMCVLRVEHLAIIAATLKDNQARTHTAENLATLPRRLPCAVRQDSII
eukprot:1862350-Amphidinium_carterae.2